MRGLASEIREELAELSRDPANRMDYSIYHRDGKEHVHLSTPLVRRVCASSFRKAKGLEPAEVLGICEQLLRAGNEGTRMVAFDLAFRLRKHYEPKLFDTFERWMRLYVDGWGSCDDLCTHALGCLIEEFPGLSKRLEPWTSSGNRWLRRGSAVALIYALRRGSCLDSALRMADRLISDRDDLVQKGCGWMLKEADRSFHAELLSYLERRKADVPRVTLRYAIEKMPKAVRARLLT